MASAAGVGDLIMASLAGRLAEARDNPRELQRLQGLAQLSISAATRPIARELERLGPPPLFVTPDSAIYEAVKAASAARGKAAQRGFFDDGWPDPDQEGFDGERERDDLDDADDDDLDKWLGDR
jgi:hypothetical protein